MSVLAARLIEAVRHVLLVCAGNVMSLTDGFNERQVMFRTVRNAIRSMAGLN